MRYEVWKYEGWRYVGINKEVRALDTRVHENNHLHVEQIFMQNLTLSM